jgi:hypothetical protein
MTALGGFFIKTADGRIFAVQTDDRAQAQLRVSQTTGVPTRQVTVAAVISKPAAIRLKLKPGEIRPYFGDLGS